MYWIILIFLPLIAWGISIIFFHVRLTWWEMLGQFLGSLIISLTIYFIDDSVKDTDVFFKSSIVKRSWYDEGWSEWIHKTCSRSCGKDNKQTCYYDCSYEKVHKPEWWIETTSGERIQIQNPFFQKLIHKWKQKPQFVELKRNFCCDNDGDRFQILWNGNDSLIESVTTTRQYNNKLVGNNPISYQFRKLDSEDRTRHGIYDYHNVKGFQQKTIYGHGDATQEQADKLLQKINSIYDPEKNFQGMILIYHNKTEESALLQRDYWQGGNLNEFVICVGLNAKEEVSWSYVFGWEESEIAKVKMRDFVQSQKKLNLLSVVQEIEKVVIPTYKAKKWSDWDYLEDEISPPAFWANFIILFIWNIFWFFFSVKNSFE